VLGHDTDLHREVHAIDANNWHTKGTQRICKQRTLTSLQCRKAMAWNISSSVM
jgi:hypothetical protein